MKFILVSATANMVLPPPTKEAMERVRAEFGLDEEGVKQASQALRDWLQQQPHLPHDCGKWRHCQRYFVSANLASFWLGTRGSVEVKALCYKQEGCGFDT
jgi:hypothetical protein